MTATAPTFTKSSARDPQSRFTAAETKIIERELKKIERSEGAVRPRRVVEIARAKSHPLHAIVFKMPDRDAAERFRIDLVRRMCRCVRIVWTDDETGKEKASMPFMASVQIRADEERDEEEREERRNLVERAYVSAEKALADPNTREELLAEALRQAEYWQARYAALSELSDIFAAIARTKARTKKSRGR